MEDTAELEEDNYEVVLPEEPKAKIGDVWSLGAHRLACGDATALADVERLMNGAQADLVCTDPPYNMGYEGVGQTKDRASKRILNDKMPADQFEVFLHSIYSNYKDSMKDGASIYVFYKELGSGVFMRKMVDAGLTFKQELIWAKNQIVIGGNKYQNMYEPCLLGCKGKSIKKWNGGRKERSVVEALDYLTEDELRETVKQLLEEAEPDVIREKKNLVNDLHPTMKPIRLLGKLIRNSSDPGDVVLDFFGGSGSTMIACEQLGRSCYMMELDPKFCDVIVDRWEKYTGKKSKIISEKC